MLDDPLLVRQREHLPVLHCSSCLLSAVVCVASSPMFVVSFPSFVTLPQASVHCPCRKNHPQLHKPEEGSGISSSAPPSPPHPAATAATALKAATTTVSCFVAELASSFVIAELASSSSAVTRRRVEGFNFEQRHVKKRVRVARVWKTKEGKHYVVEWRVSISLLSDCVNSYLRDDNSDIVATDTMKNTVYAKAKECSELLSVENFAIELAKYFISFYRQVGEW
ncbi:Uricase-2 isozyme [Arachis hypogaea]|nr:Uricase-2 isozyme [Arachis hypogaea]